MAGFNRDEALTLMLKHEGGYVDHPNDPGGATNLGVTLGTAKALGLDKDDDGDVDKHDVKLLTEDDAKRVFRRYYWDKVRGDELPSGVDYAVGDFAVNSGPKRAVKHLQRAVGVKEDGDIGPVTLAAVRGMDPAEIVNRVCDSRLAFMRAIRGGSLWRTFGRGWQRRVDDVRRIGLEWVATEPKPEPVAPPAVVDVVEDADGGGVLSSTNIATGVSAVSGIATAIASLHPVVAGMVVLLIAGGAFWVIRERQRKAGLARAAKAAL